MAALILLCVLRPSGFNERSLSAHCPFYGCSLPLPHQGNVQVQKIDFPKLELAAGQFNPRLRKCNHGVILKIVTTNICGSDQHMVC